MPEPDLREDVLNGVRQLVDASLRPDGLCVICGQLTVGEHCCNPDEAVDTMIASSWRHLLTPGPASRAKGYAVR